MPDIVASFWGQRINSDALFLPSPLGGEGSGVRGRDLQRQNGPPLNPDPSPPRGEGRKNTSTANNPRNI
jgi:hypothetical protein